MSASEDLERSNEAAGYATKYMTKEDNFLSRALKEYRVRRFQSSQSIGSQDEWGKDESMWEMKTFIQSEDYEDVLVFDLNRNKELTRRDYTKATGLYPSPEEYEKSDLERTRRKKLDK
jgi:hypothetical protein